MRGRGERSPSCAPVVPTRRPNSDSDWKSWRAARSVFIDTECSRLTDRPLRMIRRLSVRILWNVAFQTLKGRGGRHGNGTGGWRWGVPRERKGQQNVKHLQLCKGEEETCMSLPTKRAGGGPVTASSGRPRGTHACRSRKAEWAEEAQVLAFALEGTRCHDLRSRVQSRVWGRGH